MAGGTVEGTYTPGKTRLQSSDKEFWAWSWDEMAKYDKPANIEYILGVTGARQLTYIGHSQGTEMALGRLSEDAELNKMINLFVALAPVAMVGDIIGPVRIIASYAKDIESVYSGLFQKFDYGSEKENVRHYNQTVPPLYHVRKIEAPVALFTGPEDWLSDPTDVSKLRPLLKNVIYEKDIPRWNHFDFIWGMNAPQSCYDDIIHLIRRIQQ